MHDEPLDEFLKAMLEANQKNKAKAERQIQEEKVREENKRKPYMLIKQQTERLVNLLGTIIQQFNQHSTSDQRIKMTEQDITEDKAIYHIVRYEAPYKKSLVLVFLTLYPALDLTHENQGFVSLATYSAKHNIYFLWSRLNDNDLLGEWIACWVKIPSDEGKDQTPLSVYNPESETVLRSLSSHTVRYETNIRKAFSQLMVEVMGTPE